MGTLAGYPLLTGRCGSAVAGGGLARDGCSVVALDNRAALHNNNNNNKNTPPPKYSTATNDG